MTEVVLKPQSIALYTNRTDLEPQYVQGRSVNSAYLYLDAQQNTLELDKRRMLLSTVRNIDESPGVLLRASSRIRLASAGMQWITPNVNPRNNQVKFFSLISGLEHEVFVPEQFVETADSLMDQLILAMNSVSGASGITFTKLTVSGNPVLFDISASAPFYFLKDCNAVQKGEQLWNLPRIEVANTVFRIGAIGLYYTRYVDIISNRLNSNTKLPTRSNSSSDNIIYRMFVQEPTKPDTVGIVQFLDIAINVLSSDSISVIDFELRDQFGDLIYVPAGAPGTGSGIWWDLNLIVEI